MLRVLGCQGLYIIYRVLGVKGVRVLGPILYIGAQGPYILYIGARGPCILYTGAQGALYILYRCHILQS